MTKKEWYEKWETTCINFCGTGGHTGIYQGRISEDINHQINYLRTFLKMGLRDTCIGGRDGLVVPPRHYQVVKYALFLGYYVSDDILKDYPELVGKRRSKRLWQKVENVKVLDDQKLQSDSKNT